MWVFKNFGGKWEEIYKVVCLVKWGLDNIIFFIIYVNGFCKVDFGVLELWRILDLGKSFKIIGVKIYLFGFGGCFFFVFVMVDKDIIRRIYVLID